MKISCPHCGQHYEIEDSAQGVEVTCEKCGNTFAVSAPAEPIPDGNDADSSKESHKSIDEIVSRYLRPSDGYLIRQVLEIVIRERKAKTSLFQRRLGINYNTAAELMDELERRGVVSGPTAGGSEREILLPPEVFDDKTADPPLTWDSFNPPPEAPMSKEAKQELHGMICVFMNVAAWALMVLAMVSSIVKEAFGFPEIFFALMAIFILLARPKGGPHAE